MEKKSIALVTGASSGIGKAIAERLCQRGYEVYGIGRNFSKGENPSNLNEIIFDLRQTEKMPRLIKEIQSQGSIEILVNAAGTAFYGLHEELQPEQISDMVRVNLEAPMILTNLLLRDLKQSQGYIINISSVTATSVNPHGVAYGATKSGLTGFSRSLFEEARKYGIHVCDIRPDLTESNLYRNANFTTAKEREAHLLPEDVARAVDFILDAEPEVVIHELALKPQKNRIEKRANEKSPKNRKKD